VFTVKINAGKEPNFKIIANFLYIELNPPEIHHACQSFEHLKGRKSSVIGIKETLSPK
jgi:hypothetical protein